MSEQLIDLRELLLMIREKKGINAQLGLDLGCEIETGDVKPLVKVINYILNYLSRLSEETLQITLTLQQRHINMSFFVSVEQSELPPISEHLEEAIAPYDATFKMEHQPGKYVQCLLVFNKEE